MLKLFIKAFLSGFLHDVLQAEVGTKLFNGHVTVLEVTESTATTEVNIGDGYKYKITIEHVKEGEDFSS